MASSSSSLSLSFPSSSLSGNWEHDVFPSFHGPDVRKTFISHVFKEFRSKGINLFIDNEIQRGKFIGLALKQAIKGSKIAIVLLSKNYASSSWCLDELVEIMKKESGQTVMTIFYEVDPTDVKKQTGYFGKVFENTCLGKDKKKIETWRNALERVATIAGYHSSNWDDKAGMIENMAANISKMLDHLTPSHDFDHLIGMKDHMQRINPLLRLDLDEVRIIGIWGPSGIGKTTIARFLYEQVSGSFQNRAFMVNIKESYPKLGLDEYNAQLQLQNQMLSQMINQKDMVISHLGVAQGRLGNRKVILVLDDVDQLTQLTALAKDAKWFGPKSRIIITTEDKKLLKAHGINHIYKVDFPTTDEALKMFCMYAFDQCSPIYGFDGLAIEITHIVGNLPLGLKVTGSYFRGLSKEEWSMEIPRLRTNLNGEIEGILKFSYDALCDEDKNLFLHIACFFNNEYVEKVEAYLYEIFQNVRRGLQVLAEKSLISIEYDRIHMHNLLAQLGQDIVRKQSIREPGQRQFLVDDKDIREVLNDSRAITKSVIGIDSMDGFDTTKKTFEGISSLQFLRVGYTFRKTISVSSLPPKLRFLDWECLPMKYLPFTINMEFLVELRMRESKLTKLWDGIKVLRNLKWVDLHKSRNLKKLPNLSMATNLQELNLSGCSSLKELPSSIGYATNLKELYLIKCSSLVKLPSSIGNLHKLQKLYMQRCSKLKALPININMESLDLLNLSDCSLLESFPEISTNIKDLNLIGTSITEVPCSISSWPRLCLFYMPYSENLKDFPYIHNIIAQLHSSDTKIQELGPWVKGLSGLQCLVLKGMHKLVLLSQLPDFLSSLNLNGCSSLVSLPQLPDSLRVLEINGCSSLVSLPQLPNFLRILDAENCESLEKLDISFSSPDAWLKFVNCFKLNQEARDLIFQRSTRGYVVLPGKEVPECFTYRAYGNSVTAKLNQNTLPTSTKFKICILFDNKGEDRVGAQVFVYCRIKSKQNSLTKRYLSPVATEHLYIFDVEAEEVTSTEFPIEFELRYCQKNWEIKECGILQLLENHVNEEDERFRGGDEAIIEKIASESIDEEDEILENHVDEYYECSKGGDDAIIEKISSEYVDEEDERFRGNDEAISEKISSEIAKKRSVKRNLWNILMKM